jgi:DNA ligase (NAD+)
LEHFASRQAMDIRGLGESAVGQLVGLKLVRSFSDIYKLKLGDLLKLELFKDRKALNLLEAIKKSKAQPLSRLIFALGIRHVGQKAAYVLAQRFLSMEKLMAAGRDELDGIYEVGPALAGSIKEYFSLPQTKRLIFELKDAGVNFKEEALSLKKGALTGKTVVFTGELKNFSRAQAEQLVRERAGNVSSGVSKETDLVVAGADPGSKYAKAKKLGVRIIREEDFSRLLDEA